MNKNLTSRCIRIGTVQQRRVILLFNHAGSSPCS
jgi:hypothetical protein